MMKSLKHKKKEYRGDAEEDEQKKKISLKNLKEINKSIGSIDQKHDKFLLSTAFAQTPTIGVGLLIAVTSLHIIGSCIESRSSFRMEGSELCEGMAG